GRSWSTVSEATALGYLALYSCTKRAIFPLAAARGSAYMISCSACLGPDCRLFGSLSSIRRFGAPSTAAPPSPARPPARRPKSPQPLLRQANGEVNPVGPDLHVVAFREVAPPEGLVLRRPGFRPPQDGTGRQARRLRPQQRGLGHAKIPRRQAMPVQQG